MLSLFEQYEIKKVTDDFKRQVVEAIKTKPIKRLRSRWNRAAGERQYTSFEAPVNASGKLANSVQDVMTDQGIKVVCESYIDNLIYGTPPGEPVSQTDIQKWMESKKLPNLGFKTPGSTLISDKINKEGSSIFLYYKGKDSGLLTDVNIDASVEALKAALTHHYANQVASEIVQTFKIAA